MACSFLRILMSPRVALLVCSTLVLLAGCSGQAPPESATVVRKRIRPIRLAFGPPEMLFESDLGQSRDVHQRIIEWVKSYYLETNEFEINEIAYNAKPLQTAISNGIGRMKACFFRSTNAMSPLVPTKFSKYWVLRSHPALSGPDFVERKGSINGLERATNGVLLNALLGWPLNGMFGPTGPTGRTMINQWHICNGKRGARFEGIEIIAVYRTGQPLVSDLEFLLIRRARPIGNQRK